MLLQLPKQKKLLFLFAFAVCSHEICILVFRAAMKRARSISQVKRNKIRLCYRRENMPFGLKIENKINFRKITSYPGNFFPSHFCRMTLPLAPSPIIRYYFVFYKEINYLFLNKLCVLEPGGYYSLFNRL